MKQCKFFYVATILFLQAVYLSGSFTVTGFSEAEVRERKLEDLAQMLKESLSTFLNKPEFTNEIVILQQIQELKKEKLFEDALLKNFNGTGSLLEIFMNEPSVLMMLLSNLDGDSKIFEIKDRDRNNILHKLAYKALEHQGSLDGKKEKYLELIGMLQSNYGSKYNKLLSEKNLEAIDPFSIMSNNKEAIALTLFDKIQNAWNLDNNVHLKAINELKAYCELLAKRKILQDVVWTNLSGILLFEYFKQDSELLNILFFYMTNFNAVFESKTAKNWNILHDLVHRMRMSNDLIKKQEYFNCMKFLQNENPVKFEQLMLTDNQEDITPLEMMRKEEPFLDMVMVKNFNLSKASTNLLKAIFMAAFNRYFNGIINNEQLSAIVQKIKDQCSFDFIQNALSARINGNIIFDHANDSLIFKDLLFTYFPSNEALEKLGGVNRVKVLLQNKINNNRVTKSAWIALKNDFDKKYLSR